MGTRAKILIVDDEPAIREMIGFTLSHGGFAYVEAGDAVEAREKIADEGPDLVLLDWMLPGESGYEMARGLKKDVSTRELPIIMLTAKGEELDKVRGLDAGTDDYVTKPFSPRELLSRIKAVLRRSAFNVSSELLEVDGLKLNPGSHRVSVGDTLLELAPAEFNLLHFFMSHPERVYSRSQLIDCVWGANVYVEERTVDVHVRRLRMALEPSRHDGLIQTVRGAGYRFSARS